MQAIKRVRVGAITTVDVSGTGDWVVGIITASEGRKVQIDVPGDAELLEVSKEVLFKASKADLEAYAAQSGGDVEGEATEKAEDTKPEEDTKPVLYGDDELTAFIKALVVDKLFGLDVSASYINVATAFELMGIKEHKGMKTTVKGMKAKWGHLNNGQQRMIMGNCLKKYLKLAGKDQAREIMEKV